MKLLNFFIKHWPYWVIFLVVALFFYPVWFKGLVPVPGDITVGVYYPWLDYKWGYDVGVPVKNNLPSDIVSVHLPFRIFSAEQLRLGKVPLWNPLVLSGTPLVGNFQSAVFYPLNFLLFIFSTINAWTIQIILQPLITAVFTYLLLRQWQLNKVSSLFGALAFAFTGWLMTWMEYNIHGHSAYWLPAILFLVDKYLAKSRMMILILLSLAIALDSFSGYPQMMIYQALAVGLYLLIKLISNSRYNSIKVELKKVLFLCLFAVLGLTLAAIQILPGAELLLRSNRVTDSLTLQSANQGFLPFQHLIGFLAPDFFGNPSTNNWWGIGFYDNWSVHASITALILAIIAMFFQWKNFLTKYLTVLLVISLLMALRTPISTWLYNSNLLGFQAAVASRSLFLTAFSVAMLSAIGINHVPKIKWSNKLFFIILVPWTIILTIIILAFWSSHWLSVMRLHFLITNYLGYFDNYLTNTFTGLRNLILPTAVLACITVLLYSLRWKRIRVFAIFTFFILLISEQFRFGYKYLTFNPRSLIFPTTPVIEFLKQKQSEEGPFRVEGGDVVPMNMLAPYGLETAQGYDAFYPLEYAKFLSTVNNGNPNVGKGRYGGIEIFDSKLLDLANVRYVLALKRDDTARADKHGQPGDLFKLKKLVPVFEDGTVVVYENTQTYPRAWLEINGQKVESIISYTEYQPQQSILNINASESGVLVVSEQFYPGWKAFVDDKQVDIFPIQNVFRGIALTEGKHIVRFTYQPLSFKIGMWLSLGTAIFLLLLFIYEQKTQNSVGTS